MCDPATIAGIALSVASTGANYAAQQKVQAARDDAMGAERIRQNAFDHEASAVNEGARDRYKDTGKDEAKSARALGDYFKGQSVPQPAAEAALPVSASNVTVSEENKQRGQAQAFTDRTGEALGQLRAFGDVLGNNSLLQARDAGTVGQIGGYKRGSSGVLSYELDNANSAGDGLKLFGDILGGVGGLATSKGLSGTPGAAGSAPFAPNTSLGGYLGGTRLTPPAVNNFLPGYAR